MLAVLSGALLFIAVLVTLDSHWKAETCLVKAFEVVKHLETQPGIDLRGDPDYERWRSCYTGDTWEWARER